MKILKNFILFAIPAFLFTFSAIADEKAGPECVESGRFAWGTVCAMLSPQPGGAIELTDIRLLYRKLEKATLKYTEKGADHFPNLADYGKGWRVCQFFEHPTVQQETAQVIRGQVYRRSGGGPGHYADVVYKAIKTLTCGPATKDEVKTD